MRRDGPDRVVVMDDGSEARGEVLVIATGRKPRVEDIGLETVGIEPGRRGIEVDERCRAADGVWAIGDVAGGGFTHVSKYQGRIAASDILGHDVKADYRAVPRVYFTDPEVAAVGMTEAEAREAGLRLGQPDRATSGSVKRRAGRRGSRPCAGWPRMSRAGDPRLVLGDVREQRDAGDVADRPDALAGAAALVDLDPAAARLDADGLEAEPSCAGAAGRDDEHLAARLGAVVEDRRPLRAVEARRSSRGRRARARRRPRADLGEQRRRRGRLALGEPVAALDDRHPRAEAGEELRELDRDDAAADEHDALGDLRRASVASRFVQ